MTDAEYKQLTDALSQTLRLNVDEEIITEAATKYAALLPMLERLVAIDKKRLTENIDCVWKGPPDISAYKTSGLYFLANDVYEDAINNVISSSRANIETITQIAEIIKGAGE